MKTNLQLLSGFLVRSAASAILAAIAAAANAVPVSDASFSATATSPDFTTALPLPVPVTDEDDSQLDGASRSTRASASGGRNPMADVQGSASAMYAAAAASATWEAIVSGPGSGDVIDVPLYFALRGQASAGGDGYAFAASMVQFLSVEFMPPIVGRADSDHGTPDPSSYDIVAARVVPLYPGQEGVLVRMSVVAWGRVDGSGTGSFQALADPQIWIDPTWAHVDRYTITYSPNLTGSIAVPAPGLLGLWGCVAAAFLIRRRRAPRRTTRTTQSRVDTSSRGVPAP